MGRDDNTPMKKVTGGGAPAGIWHTFMVATLPRLQSTPIPGSELPQALPPPSQDAIGDALNGQIDVVRPPEGAGAQPAPADPNAPPY